MTLILMFSFIYYADKKKKKNIAKKKNQCSGFQES